MPFVTSHDPAPSELPPSPSDPAPPRELTSKCSCCRILQLRLSPATIANRMHFYPGVQSPRHRVSTTGGIHSESQVCLERKSHNGCHQNRLTKSAVYRHHISHFLSPVTTHRTNTSVPTHQRTNAPLILCPMGVHRHRHRIPRITTDLHRTRASPSRAGRAIHSSATPGDLRPYIWNSSPI